MTNSITNFKELSLKLGFFNNSKNSKNSAICVDVEKTLKFPNNFYAKLHFTLFVFLKKYVEKCAKLNCIGETPNNIKSIHYGDGCVKLKRADILISKQLTYLNSKILANIKSSVL